MRFIPVAEPIIGQREIDYVNNAVRSGWVSSIGPYISKFELGFAEYIGAAHAIAVSNGTVGLHLVLHSLGIGPGDEVLVPALTFVATAHAVLQTGATPVFVDVEPDTWCIDPVAAERAVSTRTRAIIPVHLYGHPADMSAIDRLAETYGLLVIEDSAEAHGAEVDGQKVGSLGNAGVFSFYGNKIITTGEGGMVVTNDAILAERLRYLKDHGMTQARRYYHTELAFNYRLTNLQAALGLAQLEQIENFVHQKRKIAEWYVHGLQDLDCIQLPVQSKNTKNVYWLFSIVLNGQCNRSRDVLGQLLRQQGIDSRPFFEPMHCLPHLLSFKTMGRDDERCHEAERLGACGMNLPSACTLDEATVKYITDTIRRILG